MSTYGRSPVNSYMHVWETDSNSEPSGPTELGSNSAGAVYDSGTSAVLTREMMPEAFGTIASSRTTTSVNWEYNSPDESIIPLPQLTQQIQYTSDMEYVEQSPLNREQKIDSDVLGKVRKLLKKIFIAEDHFILYFGVIENEFGFKSRFLVDVYNDFYKLRVRGRKVRNSYIHPHISDGRPCWGNIVDEIKVLFKEDFVGFVGMMKEFLRSYNSIGAYPGWREVPVVVQGDSPSFSSMRSSPQWATLPNVPTGWMLNSYTVEISSQGPFLTVSLQDALRFDAVSIMDGYFECRNSYVDRGTAINGLRLFVHRDSLEEPIFEEFESIVIPLERFQSRGISQLSWGDQKRLANDSTSDFLHAIASGPLSSIDDSSLEVLRTFLGPSVFLDLVEHSETGQHCYKFVVFRFCGDKVYMRVVNIVRDHRDIMSSNSIFTIVYNNHDILRFDLENNGKVEIVFEGMVYADGDRFEFEGQATSYGYYLSGETPTQPSRVTFNHQNNIGYRPEDFRLSAGPGTVPESNDSNAVLGYAIGRAEPPEVRPAVSGLSAEMTAGMNRAAVNLDTFGVLASEFASVPAEMGEELARVSPVVSIGGIPVVASPMVPSGMAYILTDELRESILDSVHETPNPREDNT